MILNKKPNLRFYLVGILLFLLIMRIDFLNIYYEASDANTFPYLTDGWFFILLFLPTTWFIAIMTITIFWLLKFINFKVAYITMLTVAIYFIISSCLSNSVDRKFKTYLGSLHKPYMEVIALHEHTYGDRAENFTDGRFSVPTDSGFDKFLKQKCDPFHPDHIVGVAGWNVDFWYCREERIIIVPQATAGNTYIFE
ncbi:MAG: hypothetical protein AB7F40_12265, partial [Victivallaceae bacterium]